MNIKPFQTRFQEALNSGEAVIRRLTSSRVQETSIVDFIRVMIEAELSNEMSEATNVDLASALVQFQELHPDHTAEKIAMLKCIGQQAVELARILDEDSQETKAFYASIMEVKGTPFHTLLLSVIECLHPDWTASIKKEKASFVIDKLKEIGGLSLAYIVVSFIINGMAMDAPFAERSCCLIPVIGQDEAVRAISGTWTSLFGTLLSLVTWGCLIQIANILFQLVFKRKRILIPT